jgi:hypothetical protein
MISWWRFSLSSLSSEGGKTLFASLSYGLENPAYRDSCVSDHFRSIIPSTSGRQAIPYGLRSRHRCW